MAQPKKVKQLTDKEFLDMQAQLEATSGIEAGGLGPLDYLGGGMALKNMYKWGKNIYKTSKTVAKDIAKHPKKSWADSFHRWDSKPRGAYPTPFGAKQGAKAAAVPFTLAAAAGGTAAVNAFSDDPVPENKFSQKDIEEFNRPITFDDKVQAAVAAKKSGFVDQGTQGIYNFDRAGNPMPEDWAGPESYASVDPLNLFGNKNGVNPFESRGNPITNDRFNGGEVPPPAYVSNRKISQDTSDILDLF